jgi:enoyl-[acyl-carrier-protein] reductase (NADH)
MNREEVEACSRIAQKLAMAKQSASIHLREENPAAYEEIRNLLGDCQEELAIMCDCAPIKLISGQVDEIMKNFYEIQLQK